MREEVASRAVRDSPVRSTRSGVRCLCRPDCRFHAQHCPKRLGGNLEFRQPKGGKGRTLVIPDPLVRELKAHWRKRKKVKETVGEQWEENDLLPEFARQAVRTARRLG